MQQFLNLTRFDLEKYLCSHGIATVHAGKLFRQAYSNLGVNPWNLQSLPRKLQGDFPGRFQVVLPEISSLQKSSYDHSVKFLLKLEESLEIEMVLMPEKNRITLCVSSQVGCRQACVFCHTGKMGLKRNLTAGEIVSQVYIANKWLSENIDWYSKTGLDHRLKVTNIVFMGMGEPLDNVDEIIRGVEILTDDYGFAFARRKITISTAGHLEGLKKLLDRFPTISIAFSLHAASNQLRSRIMPINRRWSVEEVVQTIKAYNQKTNRSVLIQYTLISKVNDGLEHAKQLVELLRPLKVKVNLIPFNPVEPVSFSEPSVDSLESFRDHLHKNGIRVMVRYSKGQDIAAACGQLVAQ